MVARAPAQEQRSVQPERVDVSDALGVSDQQRFVVGDNSVVHSVPVATQIDSDFVDRPADPTDLDRRPPPGPIRQRRPRPRDPRVDCRPRPRRTRCLTAAPPMLVPHQARLPPEARQINQLQRGLVLDLGSGTALATPTLIEPGLDMHPNRTVRTVMHVGDVHLWQTDQQPAHAHRVARHRGSLDPIGVGTNDSVEPLRRDREPSATYSARSDPKSRRTSPSVTPCRTAFDILS